MREDTTQLDRTMSTLVKLSQMRDAEKVRFIDVPITLGGLYGNTVVDPGSKIQVAEVPSAPQLPRLSRHCSSFPSSGGPPWPENIAEESIDSPSAAALKGTAQGDPGIRA